MNDLDQRLHELGSQITPPEVALADDLARGRSRLRRHRMLAGAGAVTAVAVIGLAGAVGPGLVTADDKGPGYGGGDGTPLPGPETTPPVEQGDREIPRIPQAEGSMPAPLDSGNFAGNETLRLYNQVLAERLDPSGKHLDREVSSMQGGGYGSLGSKFGWHNPGEDGLGVIAISVNGGWQETGWSCGMPQVDITCRDITAPGGLEGQVAEYDGGRDVAVEHADGTVVILSVSTLFGNNSTVPVSEIDLTVEDLAAAAADGRLKLPDFAGDVPELLSQRELTTVGIDRLVDPGESYAKGFAGNDIQPFQQGEWSDGANSGELFWDSILTTGTLEDYGCLDVQFTRCVERDVEGRTVMVGYVRNKWGGGVQVIYGGAVYEIRVVFKPDQSGDEFPIDRAAEFVVDDRWQPGG